MVYQQKSITNGNLARVSSQCVREDLHLKQLISPQDVKFCCNSEQLSIEHYAENKVVLINHDLKGPNIVF